ncbi:MAG: hypothetical protein ABEL76_04860, partial [Bradymonadaceae bacterium]
RTIFNHESPPRMRHAELEPAEPLSEETYAPGGRTALLDAVGYTIDRMGERFDDLPEEEKPSDVLVAIITDGKENASEEYDRAQIEERIREQEQQWGWDFVYIGAGVGDFADADAMGVADDARSNPDRDHEGLREAYDQVAAASANVRSDGSPGDFQDGGELDAGPDEGNE